MSIDIRFLSLARRPAGKRGAARLVLFLGKCHVLPAGYMHLIDNKRDISGETRKGGTRDPNGDENWCLTIRLNCSKLRTSILTFVHCQSISSS